MGSSRLRTGGSWRVGTGLALAALVAVGWAWWHGRGPNTSSEDLRLEAGGVELGASLHLPPGRGPFPGLVLVPGWGDARRDDDFFRVHGQRLAAAGFAVLAYDKRGCGDSGGHWRLASLEDQARDALAGVDLLRNDERVRADSVGLLGTSLGGTVALLAASLDARVPYVATLCLALRPPGEQYSVMVEADLLRRGHGADDARRAGDLDRRVKETYRTNAGWDGLRAAFAEARSEPWFADSLLELLPPAPGTWQAYRDMPMDFDVLPLLAAFDRPLFAAQGEDDWLVPGPWAFEQLRALAAEPGRDVTLALIAGAEHSMRITGTRSRWPEEHWRALLTWLERVAPGAPRGATDG